MNLFEHYLRIHEQECNLPHKEHPGSFLVNSPIDCIKSIMRLMPTREQYFHHIKGLTTCAAYSNDINKINYFFNYDPKMSQFVCPKTSNEIDNERLDWEFSDFSEDSLDLHPAYVLNWAIQNYSLAFLEKCLIDWKIKADDCFSTICRYLVMCSIGYTHWYFNYENRPGDFNNFKKFYNLKVWEISNKNDAKEQLFDCLEVDLARCYNYSFLDPINLDDDWWLKFIFENKHLFKNKSVLDVINYKFKAKKDISDVIVDILHTQNNTLPKDLAKLIASYNFNGFNGKFINF